MLHRSLGARLIIFSCSFCQPPTFFIYIYETNSASAVLTGYLSVRVSYKICTIKYVMWVYWMQLKLIKRVKELKGLAPMAITIFVKIPPFHIGNVNIKIHFRWHNQALRVTATVVSSELFQRNQTNHILLVLLSSIDMTPAQYFYFILLLLNLYWQNDGSRLFYHIDEEFL